MSPISRRFIEDTFVPRLREAYFAYSQGDYEPLLHLCREDVRWLSPITQNQPLVIGLNPAT